MSLIVIFFGTVYHSISYYRYNDDSGAIVVNYSFLTLALVEVICRIFQPHLNGFLFEKGAICNFFPVNVLELQHRQGVFVMIVLGETFIALLTTNPNDSSPGRVINFLVCAFLLILAFAIFFYDSVHRIGTEHVMARSKSAGALWQILHVCIGYSLFVIGVACKETYSKVCLNEAITEQQSQLLALACCLTTLLCSFLRALHKGTLSHRPFFMFA